MRRFLSLILALLLVAGSSDAARRVRKKTTNVSSPTSSVEAKKRQEAAQKEIKLTEQQIKENDSKVKKGLNELGKIDRQISITNGRIAELNKRINTLRNNISSLETNISTNEKELEKLRSEYLKAVKKMRVTKKNRSNLAFVFSSKSLNQAMRRLRYLKEFSQWKDRQSSEINSKITVLKNQKEALTKAREEQTQVLALQQSSQSQLKLQSEKQKAIVAELKENGKALESHLKRKQAEAKELGNMVSQLIAEEQRKAQEEARKRAEEEARLKAAEEERIKAEEERQRQEELLAMQQSEKKTKNKEKETKKQKESKKEKTDKKKPENEPSPTVYADARKRAPRSENSKKENKQSSSTSGNFQDMRGKLPLPASGRFTITSVFGRQNLPDLPNVEFDNPGIDAETDSGSSALAVFKGKVSGVYLLPGYNTVVIVNHGNYYTVYGNISTPNVKIGDNVDMGSNLGKLAPEEDDPSHSSIHFEVWKNREKLNPQDWIRN